MRQLREAVRRGLKDGDYLKKTEELDAPRDRKDFKALLRKLPGYRGLGREEAVGRGSDVRRTRPGRKNFAPPAGPL